jgi:putative flippase GtrA
VLDAMISSMRRLKEFFAALLQDRFVRFVLVGVVNTAFSYAIYVVLVYIGLNFALASLGSCVLGILFSFRTHGLLVFDNPAKHLLFRYVVSWSVLYLCNIGMIKLLLIVGFDAYIAGALAVPPTAVLSYAAKAYFVFRPPAAGSASSRG